MSLIHLNPRSGDGPLMGYSEALSGVEYLEGRWSVEGSLTCHGQSCCTIMRLYSRDGWSQQMELNTMLFCGWGGAK